jgi:hypothetical protein
MSGTPRSAGHLPRAIGIYTETLARLYAKQGLYDQALRIYRHLLQTQPENLEWQQTIATLERQCAMDVALPGTPSRAVQIASEKRSGQDQRRLHRVLTQLERWLDQLRRQRQS